jgi:hypothetical protein
MRIRDVSRFVEDTVTQPEVTLLGDEIEGPAESSHVIIYASVDDDNQIKEQSRGKAIYAIGLVAALITLQAYVLLSGLGFRWTVYLTWLHVFTGLITSATIFLRSPLGISVLCILLRLLAVVTIGLRVLNQQDPYWVIDFALIFSLLYVCTNLRDIYVRLVLSTHPLIP